MNYFLRVLTEAYQNNIQAQLERFAANHKETVIIGNNDYGRFWEGKIRKLGINFIGFVSYNSKEEAGAYALDEVLDSKWNVCICNIAEFDADSKMARLLSTRQCSYIDLTYIVNNRFVDHYDISKIFQNLGDVYEAYSLLEDELSKEVYLSLLTYRITRDPLALKKSHYPQYFHPLVRPAKNAVILEAGGFDGETSISLAHYLENDCKIFSFEPEQNNLLTMRENLLKNSAHSVEAIPLGLWNKKGKLGFLSDASASIVSNAAENAIPVTTIDCFIEERKARVDLIKLDIEGAEKEVLEGSRASISLYQPKLQISVYHRAGDLWTLLLELHRLNPYYKFYLGHHTNFITETVLYATI